MGYRKSEMLKKFQHDSDIAKLSTLDYGLWEEGHELTSGLLFVRLFSS
jgi:hypothetical protein